LPEVFSDTSPLQYLHQIGLLHVLPALVERVVVPPAVDEELAVGRRAGIDLPDPRALEWITIRSPASALAIPLVTDLGPGETEVLTLAAESPESIILLDDALARRAADMLGLRVRGTLGVLLDAKRAGLLPAVGPLLDRLQELRFRVSPRTRNAVLALAGEPG